MEDVTEATRACAYCRGSLEYTADPERIVCSNCRLYLRKQLPDLCRPSLTANREVIQRVGWMNLCGSLLWYDTRNLYSAEQKAGEIRFQERLAAWKEKFADVLQYRPGANQRA